MTSRIAAHGTCLVLLALFSTAAKAQSAAPRDYLLGPVGSGSSRLFLDYIYSGSETTASSNLPLPNNEALSQTGVATVLFPFAMWDHYFAVSASGGGATVKAINPSAGTETSSSGFIDPSMTFHTNFFGGPALTAEQFASFVPVNFASFHLTVNAPLGSYDANAPVNVGSNRWAFTPVVNLSLTPDEGVSWVEFYAGGRFFTSNDTYKSNSKLTQDPLGIFTVHYSHNIGQYIWAGVGFYYDSGGETFINGIPQHNAAKGIRPSATISGRIGSYRLTLRYDNTASTPNADPASGLISLRLSAPLF